MNRSFILKIIGMLALITLMSIAVSYVNGIILERQQRQNEVKADIARSSAGEQTLVGPVLVIPYIEEFTETTTENGIKKTETKREHRKAVILPDQLNLAGGFSNEFKKLGIYKALTYQLGGNIKGSFKLPANIKLTAYHNNSSLSMQPAYLSMGISDPRGITSRPSITWGNQHLTFEQGSQLKALGNGIHAPIGLLQHALDTNINFEIVLNLRGTNNLTLRRLQAITQLRCNRVGNTRILAVVFCQKLARKPLTPKALVQNGQFHHFLAITKRCL